MGLICDIHRILKYTNCKCDLQKKLSGKSRSPQYIQNTAVEKFG